MRTHFWKRWAGRAALLLAAACGGSSAQAAEQFGDLSVEANAIYTGNTFHGYAEVRVIVENSSATRPHEVRLVFPNRTWGSGSASIRSITRTVKVEPSSRQSVALWQPPLSANGDQTIQVEVDGREAGGIHAPNGNQHCNTYGAYGGNKLPTLFISRSLNFDAVQLALQSSTGAFTASKAVGEPDATGTGYQPNTWMPDTRAYGRTNWLELTYATAQMVNAVVVNSSLTLPPAGGSVVLLDEAGNRVAHTAMTTGKVTSSGSGWTSEFSFPAATNLVKSVRLEFGRVPPSAVAVDAVQIAGPTGTQWADDARASSDNSASGPAYISSSTAAETMQGLRAESGISDWSDNWLAYSAFDCVILSAADLTGLTPGVTAALTDYVYAGGQILVFGKARLPAAWQPQNEHKQGNAITGQAGFGRIYLLDQENPANIDPVFRLHLRDAIREASQYWVNLPDEGGANNNQPVVENLKIPTRTIVVIMLAFVIVIGPVNIIYLNRIGRRTWMLWTIPAISVATTLLVFAYSLLREGITPNSRVDGITLINQASHHTATIGAEAIYCPLTPSAGLAFDYHTEATPLVSHEYGRGTERELDWSQSQHLSRGWISARVPAHFHLRKPEIRRERIQVLTAEGRVQIINSLGARIKSLWYMDAQGKLFAGTDIAAGAQGALLPTAAAATPENPGAAGIWQDLTYATRTDQAEVTAQKRLSPNTYLAVLDANPFLENALGPAARPLRTKAASVVYGLLAAEDVTGGTP
ncbi:MAG TPA: hypothetical protein VF607_13285 [Verrucomicrobiae bacterium]